MNKQSKRQVKQEIEKVITESPALSNDLIKNIKIQTEGNKECTPTVEFENQVSVKNMSKLKRLLDEFERIDVIESQLGEKKKIKLSI